MLSSPGTKPSLSTTTATTTTTATDSTADDGDAAVAVNQQQPHDHQPTSLEFIEDPYLPALPAAATPSLDDLNAAFDDRLLFDDLKATHNDDDDGDGLHEASRAPVSLEWSPETELYLRQMPLEQIFCISDDRDGDDEDGDGDAELGAIDKRNRLLNAAAAAATLKLGQSSSFTSAQTTSPTAAVANSPADSRRERTQAFLNRLFGRQSLSEVRVSIGDLSSRLLRKRVVGMLVRVCVCCVFSQMCDSGL